MSALDIGPFKREFLSIVNDPIDSIRYRAVVTTIDPMLADEVRKHLEAKVPSFAKAVGFIAKVCEEQGIFDFVLFLKNKTINQSKHKIGILPKFGTTAFMSVLPFMLMDESMLNSKLFTISATQDNTMFHMLGSRELESHIIKRTLATGGNPASVQRRTARIMADLPKFYITLFTKREESLPIWWNLGVVDDSKLKIKHEIMRTQVSVYSL